MTITVTGQNDAPEIAGEEPAPIYSEQGVAAAVASGLTVSDPDSATLSGATVAIAAGLQPGDLLNFADQNGITGSYDAATVSSP